MLYDQKPVVILTLVSKEITADWDASDMLDMR